MQEQSRAKNANACDRDDNSSGPVINRENGTWVHVVSFGIFCHDLGTPDINAALIFSQVRVQK